MFQTFTLETININDIVVYLKTIRTGLNISRKCKFVGQVTAFTKNKVKIRRLSPPDKFVTPNECNDHGLDYVYPNDVIHIIRSI